MQHSHLSRRDILARIPRDKEGDTLSVYFGPYAVSQVEEHDATGFQVTSQNFAKITQAGGVLYQSRC
jgi:hypothetical protein